MARSRLGGVRSDAAVALPFAIGNYHLARRHDRGPWQWALLTLIPIVNYFFMLHVGYVVVYAVLGRLAALQSPSEEMRR